MFKKIKRLFKAVMNVLTPAKATMTAIAAPLLAFVLLFNFLFNFLELSGTPSWGWILIILIFYFGVTFLIAMLMVLAVRILERIPKKFLRVLFFAFAVVFIFSEVSKTYGWLFFAMIFLFPAFILGGIYKWRKGELFPLRGAQRIVAFIIFLISSVSFLILMYFFFDPGKTAEDQKNMRMAGKLPDSLMLPDPSATGNYEVGYLTYGSGNDKNRHEFAQGVAFKTPSVNASLMLKSWKGIGGKLRTAFFGFDETELPLNARVWYPKNLDSAAPLILMVHGNHMAQDFSDTGYAYLGRMFASRGYIAASVDENFINSSVTDVDFLGGGLKEENGVRGWLLLKHLESWRIFTKDKSNPFFNKVDLNNIGLIGHSRGGEAVGHAAWFNRLKYFPDNARQTFNFNFNIKAVMAIAPVDGQYMPSAVLVPLNDVNYFVLQGAQDMDLISYAGLAMYKRIKFTPGFDGFKAGLYVNLANHGQFNTSWGRKDGSGADIHKFNLRQLMPPADQEKIARVYIGAFMDLNIKNIKAYEPLFMDYRVGRQWLPDLIYLNQYEPSHKKVIADFDNDLVLETANDNGGKIEVKGLTMWKERLFKTEWNASLSNAVYIGWKKEISRTIVPSYSIVLPDSATVSMLNGQLGFSLTPTDNQVDELKKKKDSQGGPASGKNAGKNATDKEKKGVASKTTPNKKDAKDKKEDATPIDFTIELTDLFGTKIRFALGDCGYLQPKINKHLTKYPFLNTAQESEAIPNFFYFDHSRLRASNASFRFDRIKSFTLIFDKIDQGGIILDDIWVTNK